MSVPRADCIICNPLGHVGCGCRNHSRCEEHRDTVDPIPDRSALAAAYEKFRRWRKIESDLRMEYEYASDKRAEAARLIQELGGKI